jgi:DNA-binding CsgD family transcriptional regulator
VSMKYPIHLTVAQRKKIKGWLRSKQLTRREVIRAKVLLRSDRSGGRRMKECAEIGQGLGIDRHTVSNIRRNFYALGLKKSIVRPSTARAPTTMTDELVAALERLLRQSPPQNKTRWSVRTLTTELKKLGYNASAMTIYRKVGKKRLLRTDRLDTQSFRVAVKKALASPCDAGHKRWTLAGLRRRLVSRGMAPELTYTQFNRVIRRLGLDPANLEKSAKQL